MAPLTPASAAAIARLRAYACTSSSYTSVSLSRRAAVLLLLFADKHGNLRVLLTLRSNQMTSFSGQVALPGGKADSLSETAFDTARREAWEEVGLPQHDMPPPFRVEHLCELPAQLAATEQVVRPCVAFLHTDASKTADSASITGENLIPKLNATEVAAVFSAPLHRFVSSKVEGSGKESSIKHESRWLMWNGGRWLMHNFFVPKASLGTGSSGANKQTSQIDKSEGDHYKVWGTTARVLIDSARIAYGKDPEFDHMKEIGDEAMVQRLVRRGRLAGERQKGASIPRSEIEKEKSVIVSKNLDNDGIGENKL